MRFAFGFVLAFLLFEQSMFFQTGSKTTHKKVQRSLNLCFSKRLLNIRLTHGKCINREKPFHARINYGKADVLFQGAKRVFFKINSYRMLETLLRVYDAILMC